MISTFDSLEVCNTIKSISGASIGSNISAEATYTEPLHKKSMGTNVQEAMLKIAYGPPEALQPVPPVVDSLKTQILEKLPDVPWGLMVLTPSDTHRVR